VPVETRKSYCRYCHNYCALDVDIEDGRAVAVRGDASDPVYGGYTCIKGRQLAEHHAHPERILRPLRKGSNGHFEEIASQAALDEIADRVRAIVDEHGPRAVASYCGTHAFQNSTALEVAKAWHAGIGSESFYSSITIDQPAKFIAMSRVGIWSAGMHGFRDADVVMTIGNNPVVSQYSPLGGIPPWSPVQALNDAKRRGLKLICIDPRRTDVARRADLHLAVRPGEDPTLLAGMLRVIFEEERYDQEFCDRWLDGVDEIRVAVEEYTLDHVETRTRVPRAQVVEAARIFSGGSRGIATTGTGPDMSPRPNLTEHLVTVLNLVCGRVNREGEPVRNPGILSRPTPKKAQPFPSWKGFGIGPRSRVRGLGQVIGEMPTAALADEILEPGDGQVKALLCIGGNPVVAWPDQQKVVRAMEALELLVCIDVRLSATSKMADFVLAPKLSFERADVPILCDTWYETPYTHYAPALVDPPDGSDTLEEWELYWELAHRMGSEIRLKKTLLPLDRKPSKDEVIEAMIHKSRVPFDEIRSHPGGRVYDVEEFVQAPDPDCAAKLLLSPDDVCAELREVRGESLSEGYSHRLISRRLRHVYNSSGTHLPALRAKGTTNPAFMNPLDLEELGIESGAVVEIESDHASILGVAESADDVSPGVVSMSHAWGDPGMDPKEVREIGSSTNRLVAADRDYDPITGMARQSAIPVNVRLAPRQP
jgi:anaerobic selenocysteine-containing dehydrogenase